MERRLSAILAADVVGYSRLMEADEADTFERLRAHRKELFEPEILKHHGRIFKLMGDGLLAEFGSAVDALECAVELQHAMAERNNDLPPDDRIEVRIGLHVGDVIVEGDDRHGDAVNVAARLQALAEPGGICVSRPVVDHVKQRLPLTFEPQGEQRLKNIADPIAVYRVRTDAARARPSVVRWLARLRRRPHRLVGFGLLVLVIAGGVAAGFLYLRPTPPLDPAARSIAVLPFVNLSGDPALDYFSDGITENVTGGLARSPDLHVVARTSTAVYKGKAADVRQIGRELNARYVLEGSVQKGADKVRIVAQLIDARSGDHVWADKFDREGKDPLSLQDEVTGRVIASLAGHQGAIAKQEYDEVWGRDTASLEEYDYFLRGHSVFFRWTKEDMAKARAIFQEGLDRFPASSLMRVKIGWTYYQDWWNNWSAAPEEDLRRAYELAQEGLAQPQPPPIAKWYGHWLLALTRLFHERDAAAAAREAEVTWALAPNDPNVLVELSEVLVWAGKPQQAIDWMQQAMRSGHELWPIDHITLAFANAQAGRHEAAIKELELQACGDCSEFSRNWRLWRMMISYLRLGRMDAARSAADAMQKARPDFSIVKARAELYYANKADTERELDELRQMGFPEA